MMTANFTTEMSGIFQQCQQQQRPVQAAPAHLRIVDRPPLDFTTLLLKNENVPLSFGGCVHFTINDQNVRKGLDRLVAVGKPSLESHHMQLLDWLAWTSRAHYDETKECVLEAVRKVSCAVINKSLSGHAQRRADQEPQILRHRLGWKVKALFADDYLESLSRWNKHCRSDNDSEVNFDCAHSTPAGQRVASAHLRHHAVRWEMFLQAQGFRRWTPETPSQTVVEASSSTNERCFYLTEDDIQKVRTEGGGEHPSLVPTFVFVDAYGKPIRVPISIRKPTTSSITMANTCVDFLATVLIVNGDANSLILHPAQAKATANNLSALAEMFGPPLMLQNRGFTQSAARDTEEAFRTANEAWKGQHESMRCSDTDASRRGASHPWSPAVVTIDSHLLPNAHIRHPWGRVIADNYTKDPHYLSLHEESGAHRPPNSFFPSHSQRALLNTWVRKDSTAAAAAAHDRLLLKQLRSDVQKFMRRHVGDWDASRIDKELFDGWEGRLFARCVAEGAARAEEEAAELAAEAAALNDNTSPLFESPVEVNDWKDLC
jgi:hypothetical protein